MPMMLQSLTTIALSVFFGTAGAAFGEETTFSPDEDVVNGSDRCVATQDQEGGLDMAKQFRLLILEKGKREDPRIEGGIERIRALNVVSESGAKVRHDSGGRFVVLESSPDAEKAIKKRLTGARIVDLDEDVKSSMPDLDPTETLFLEALKIRSSKSYREAKRKRKPGESPEEKELTSAPCIREEY